MVVYCISGLGADERVFTRLSLAAETRHIYWLKPLPGESLAAYSSRLAGQIDVSKPFTLLGVSFGGVVARELAAQLPAQRLIVVSSYVNTGQIPALVKTSLITYFLSHLPTRWLKPPKPLMAWLFGLGPGNERSLLYSIIKDTDPHFLRWALLTLLNLKELPAALPDLQLHGTADRLIPYPENSLKLLKLTDGGHFMIYSRAEEISKLINQLLTQNHD